MEKITIKKLEHVYNTDVQDAIREARKLAPSGKMRFKHEPHQIKENGKTYVAHNYNVERIGAEIHTTIYYKEFEDVSNNNTEGE